MSNLYSKVAPKPEKKKQVTFNMPFQQTHSWLNGKSRFSATPKFHFGIFHGNFLSMTCSSWIFNQEHVRTLMLCLSLAVETLNNGSPVLLSPPQQNEVQGSSTASSSGATNNNNNNKSIGNMQITQPLSSPLDSPLPSPVSSINSMFALQMDGSAAGAGCNLLSDGSEWQSTSLRQSLYGRADTSDPNWQGKKCSVRERNAMMFNNELMSDIAFLVGADCEFEGCRKESFWLIMFLLADIQRIPAHKYVLATGSSVFYAMVSADRNFLTKIVSDLIF